MDYGEVLRCGNCGAAVPILGERSTTCLYCLAEVPVPAHIRRPFAERRQVEADLERALAGLAASRRGLRSPQLLPLLLGGVVIAISLSVFIPLAHSVAAGHGGGFTLLVIGIAYGGLIVAFVGGGLYARHHARRRLARLPLARVSVDRFLTAYCAGCGARLNPPADSIQARCRSCGAESLMPAPLVRRSLQRQHQRVLQLRARIGLARETALSSMEAANQFGRLVVAGAGVVFGAGICVYFVLEPPLRYVGVARGLGIAIAVGSAVPLVLGLRRGRRASRGRG